MNYERTEILAREGDLIAVAEVLRRRERRHASDADRRVHAWKKIKAGADYTVAALGSSGLRPINSIGELVWSVKKGSPRILLSPLTVTLRWDVHDDYMRAHIWHHWEGARHAPGPEGCSGFPQDQWPWSLSIPNRPAPYWRPDKRELHRTALKYMLGIEDAMTALPPDTLQILSDLRAGTC